MANKTFSAHVLNVFANHNTTYEQMYNLMKDVALRKEIFDENTNRIISKAEANEKIAQFSREILGIGKNPKKKEMRRAMRDHGNELFDIIIDVIDEVITTGWGNEPWFEFLVEYKNIDYGDEQDFKVDSPSVLVISKQGESHHDHILQRILPGQPISIPTARYGAKVGADINRFIVGQEDWATLVDAISKAFIKKIQELAAAQITALKTQLPANVKGTGALNSTNKPAFDKVIAKVQGANDGAEVIIMGTKVALKDITAIADVNWGAKDQRDAVMNTGTIGIYEGVRLVEIPQRYSDKTLADSAKMISDEELLIVPVGYDARPIKFVDEGDTEITSVEEKGESNGRWDDIMTYEVQRRMGSGVVVGRLIGNWTLPTH